MEERLGKTNILEIESIPKLLRKFAVPSVISLLVNALYNIVDQIFIGRGVGYLGNGATNVILPLVVMNMAICMLFGDGAATFFSVKLGEKKEDQACHAVGNADQGLGQYVACHRACNPQAGLYRGAGAH